MTEPTRPFPIGATLTRTGTTHHDCIARLISYRRYEPYEQTWSVSIEWLTPTATCDDYHDYGPIPGWYSKWFILSRPPIATLHTTWESE